MIRSAFFIFLALFPLSLALPAQNFSGGFAFTLPPFDSTSQEFLPNFPRHTISDFVQSAENKFMSNGHPIRFWGVNFTTGACFPDKELSPGIAARMRKMGINLVRFHHMDNPWTSSNASIFNRNGVTTALNTSSLDRFHFLLSNMKEEGIYANINLHVSRTFTEGDGVLYADSILDFGKAVTIFDRQLIDLQKQYAAQLLTTVNPYTNLALVDDPVVAMVEITNENTLYGFWKDDRLQPFSRGGGILSRHADTLDRLWNEFIVGKYQSQSNLMNAWSVEGSSAAEELLKDGGFESGNLNQAWTLERHETAEASMSATAINPYQGNYAARVQVDQITATNWHIQFEQNGASVQKDSAYIIRFYARADATREIQVNSIRNAEPWTWYGGTTIQLGTEWKEYSLSIVPPESNNGLTRVAFIIGGETGTYWFDKVSMTLAQQSGLEDNEDLALGNIRRISYSERFSFHDQRVADMAEFYLKLQRDYYDEMYDYLINTLGVKVPVTGSNAFGGLYEPYTHQGLDYIDDHAYWDHPRFPNVAWSPTDWIINNQSMLSNDYLGTIPGIFGGYQIQSKPFTISEYNHPQPNIYQIEMVPVLAGYGSFHGADGFMFFEYNGGDPADWTTDAQLNYFATHRNTPVMALFPIFSYAFQHGLIQEDQNPILTRYNPLYLNNLAQLDNQGRWGSFYPYDNHLALTSAIKVADFDAPSMDVPVDQISDPPYKTSTGEITCDPRQSTLQIVTPRLECVAGPLNRTFSATQNMEVIQGDKHGVVSWLSLTDDPLNTTEKSVLAIASRFQNQ
ncbi:MAG: carbohydrate binding domain-containing protein, partial [Saprospiraceae bacterium]|nr:carbohydrate binding domain-containing protein [Saprospiraceae bacterium]